MNNMFLLTATVIAIVLIAGVCLSYQTLEKALAWVFGMPLLLVSIAAGVVGLIKIALAIAASLCGVTTEVLSIACKIPLYSIPVAIGIFAAFYIMEKVLNAGIESAKKTVRSILK